MSRSRRRHLAVGVAAEVKSKLSVVEVVGETVSLKKAGTTYKGLCPFHGEKTPSFVVTPARETLALLRLRPGRRHLQLRDAARQRRRSPRRFGRSPQRAGVEIDERTKHEDAHKARLREVLDSAIAFYHAVLTALDRRASRPRLPPRPRLHRRDDRTLPARLGAGRLGPDDPDARGTKRDVRPEELVEVGLASPRQSRPRRCLRQVPRPGHLPDPRPERPRRRARRPAARGRRAEVPQLAGDAAVRQEPDALPHRQGQGPDPQVRPGRHRRGLHGRADGPPGRLRQRRRQPRHGADAGPGRAPDPLRDADRAGLRRRRGGREGRRRSGYARWPG